MKKSLIGLFVMIVTIILSLYWYDWRLVVIIFLSLLGNNLEQSK